jgi:ubiquilin
MLNLQIQGLMTNPEALAAITQIQEGLQRLQRAAPDLYSTMGMPNIGVGMNLFGGGTGGAPAAGTAPTSAPGIETFQT